MVKVCFVLLGIDFSGAETVLIKYLEESKVVKPCFAIIYNGSVFEKLKDQYGEENVKCLNIRYSKNELRFFPFITEVKAKAALKRIIDDFKPDILYANNTLEVMICKEYVKLNLIPSVGHIHDMKNYYGTVFKIIETQKAINVFEQIITVSNACKNSWGKGRIRVIYNGVPNYFWQEGKELPDQFTVGFVGMISDRKGFDLVSMAINEMPKVQWKIAYNKVEPQYINELETIKKKNNVELYKDLNYSDMPNFYDSISVLVIPSKADPLPTVAIEAMSRSRLVIGSRVDGIPELLGNKEEWLFSYKKPEEMISKINTIQRWSREELSTRIKEQHDFAERTFSLNAKVEEIDSMLSQIGQC